MKICIFGAASDSIDKIYMEKVYELGKLLAGRGHSLVFGAGATGLMGAAARGFKEAGGFIQGVIPEFFREECVEVIYTDCDEIIYTQTMSERKKIMEDECDAFVIVPGGIGTLEEFFEVLTLKQLGRHNKAIAIYNVENYYANFEKFMGEVCERKFINFRCYEMYDYFDAPEKLADYLENYVPDATPWQNRKA